MSFNKTCSKWLEKLMAMKSTHKKIYAGIVVISHILLFLTLENLIASKLSKATQITDIQLERKDTTLKAIIKNTAPALKSTGPCITAGQKGTPQEQQKPEITEKGDIKPLNADIPAGGEAVKESKGAEIKGEESDTSKKISTDSSDKEYIIGPEDVLNIQVWGNDDLKRTVEVSQEGAFTFPLIGKVHAAGLTVFAIEQYMKNRLAEGYLKDPQVSIIVSEYKNKKVVILGEVKKPGSYIIKGRTHILKLISEADGFTDGAGSIITIVRLQLSSRNDNSAPLPEDDKGSKTIEVDLDDMAAGASCDSFFVQEGDSIYVSKAPPIFVTGEVNKPGEFKWGKRLTVHHAISLAGGPTRKGALNRVEIYRSENGKEKRFKPSLSDEVMPYDIIQVPESYF